ncbi:MAG: hypothetical protein WD825_04985 [Gemmatimonadaceae bacterium]
MHARLSALLVAVGAVAAVTACGDTTAPGARFSNLDQFPVVFAMSGTPPSLPSGIAVRGGSVVRIDPSWAFDIAFDMTDAGVVRVHSARAIATELSTVNRVGFLFTPDAFSEVTRAPTTGYAYDTTFTLPVGAVMLIDVVDVRSCGGSLFSGPNIRAKMVLDSVNVVSRAVYLHMLSNPNCGLRSLVQGEPKD